MRTLSSIAVTGLFFGCSANVASQNELDAEAAGPVHGVIVVERAQQGDVAHVNVIARFVGVRGGPVDERALRTVGASSPAPAVGTCATLDDADESAMRGVELHDVGVVSLEAGNARSTLIARQVPDPIGRVTGVFYFAPGDVPAVVPQARVSLRVQGPQDTVTVTGSAPRDLGEVRVAGQNLGRPVVLPALVQPAPPFEVTWEASDDGASSFFVDVSVARRQTTRCAFADTGHGVVPAAALNGDLGQITVHRVKRERFAARGIEPGELRFDFSRTTSYTRR